MEESINIAVVKVLVNDTMDAHEVFDDAISHRESTINLLVTVLIVSHIKGEIALSIDTIRSNLIILV